MAAAISIVSGVCCTRCWRETRRSRGGRPGRFWPGRLPGPSRAFARCVASRTSSFAFKGATQNIRTIGEKLQVRTVLEGSVRRADTKLRVTAQLINAADGFHLWSATYEREMKDVFAIQDEIARAIV